MDLLAIIQDRISGKPITLLTCANYSTGYDPDAYEIEGTNALIDNASCTTCNDALPPASKNESVMPKLDSSWPQSLVDQFMKLEPPEAPFYLEPHRQIIDPAKFYLSLRHDIESGPTGPRARMGALQHDLKVLILEVQNEQ